ncbi:hypothetical protein Kpol_224p1 [Vanderwaltozyma polyspora DSM 70294]|uniref:RRM domain-containing protein n=1 Tax=Vanderwaltozyma polyspora (strain ATCC 22028 / DSM 70294 / BCRC 21397 / CBS 2163 / NBRC 10782 / NRRL Y-8283 / UCD 57-17) TaxID=436907 RepID=A7TTG1_VANPO|nr:uncharacterized protein Kpol_224p1 [Vanderwaltozyma polyspora DSM 70294]EDO14443.1 hypothetical protein Kpol_224p1 [Vanderwaltozyma polyspora DSM 70294]
MSGSGSGFKNPDLSVYVGNIDPSITKELLYELFVQISPIAKINYPKDKVLQTHQGYAFIDFYTEEDANYAIQAFNNNVQLNNRVLKVRKTNNNISSKSSTNLSQATSVTPYAKIFVKNLDSSVDVAYLSKLFKKFGSLARESEIFHLSNGELRCAYVYFKDYEKADEAIKSLDGQLVTNKRINIEYAFKENGDKKAKYGEDVDRLLNKEAIKNGLIK